MLQQRCFIFFFKLVIAISIKIYNKHKIQIKNTLVTAPAGRSCTVDPGTVSLLIEPLMLSTIKPGTGVTAGFRA